MTTAELREILDDENRKLTADELKEVVYQLKEDCAGCTQWKCDCANIELEVAREIFEEIEKHGRKMQSSDFSGDFWDIAVLMSDIAELKEKHTEGKNEH